MVRNRLLESHLVNNPYLISPFGQIVIFFSIRRVKRQRRKAESGALSAAACCDNHSRPGFRIIQEWRVPEVWQGVFDPVRESLPRASEGAVTGT